METQTTINGDLTRDPNGFFAGVCLGLAKRIGVDVFWVRLGWILSMIFFGIGFFVYIDCAITFPREDEVYRNNQKKFLGACYRLGKKLNWDVGILRFIALWTVFCSGGTGIVIYLVLAVALPEPPEVINVN